MGEATGIQWTEKTWNPIQGCHKISAGCKNCYMFSDKRRYGQDPDKVVRSADATFYAPLRKWKEPSLIFTCSWSDWFIEEADEHRADMWDVIRRTPHTYQILTKRADRILDHLPEDWGDGWPNVWLGVSVENQEQDWRIAELLKVPAAVRFLSMEPLLGPVDLSCVNFGNEIHVDTHDVLFPQHGPRFPGNGQPFPQLSGNSIDWVIVGGESGHGARECRLSWIDSIVRQCNTANVPVFVKQLGAKPMFIDSVTGEPVVMQIRDKKGGDVLDFPTHFVRQMPAAFVA